MTLNEMEQMEYEQDVTERDEYIFSSTREQLKSISLSAITGFIKNNIENFSFEEKEYYKNIFYNACTRDEEKHNKYYKELRYKISEFLGGD